MDMKKAQARLTYCHAKAERVRHWMRSLQHEIFEYEGRISQLRRLVELDAPQAIGVLDRILRQIEDYQAVRAGGAAVSYHDLSLAKEIWPDESDKSESAAENIADSASADEELSNGG
jgi:hypothetical protein